ncbi:hypothetical protein Anas_08939 [Armadillidium nasatum]|uniref:TB domain-containing protein n=1 Tax=Armadillidium nasatum TaxID=96803 RepID=A0A5N5TCB2_9CRUS|nr:hypothetical protein Anas_08939 [Armadillidium nasatum]
MKARSLKPCPEGFKAVSIGGKQDCVCDDYHVYWPDTGLCYLEYTQGPCGPNQQLVANRTGYAECKCPGFWARWTDGFCYQEYSRGPCEEGMLFMKNQDDVTGCSCSKEFIMNYYPEDNKCYPLYDQGPCEKGHILKFDYASLRPRCECKDNHMLEDDGKCYPLNTAGPCNQTQCSDGINCYLRNLDTLKTECKCLPGNVTTADGHCFEPYSRGPCKLGDWLVFIEPGVAVCKHKDQCSRFDNWFYWKEDERCYRQYSQGPCEKGQLFYLDMNTGIAGCQCRTEWTPYYWKVDGKCYEQHSIGPCSAGKYFSFNRTSGKTECNCFTSHVLESTSDTCHEQFTQGPCKEGELVIRSEKTGQLECKCSPELTSHYWEAEAKLN